MFSLFELRLLIFKRLTDLLFNKEDAAAAAAVGSVRR